MKLSEGCWVENALLIAVVMGCVHKVTCSMEDGNCDSSVIVAERDIKDYLFANYSKEGRPRKNASATVEVSVGMRISAVHDLIERENTLILEGYLFLGWKDDYLAWNETFPLSCFPQIVVPADLIWMPDVSLINAPNGMYSLIMAPGFSPYISSDGSVSFTPGGQIASNCEIDVTFFPFDKQICQVLFESWNYDNTMEKLKLDDFLPFVKIDSAWTENRQWHIEANYTHYKIVHYFDSMEYSHIAFTVVLKRKSMYYYINVIVPSIIISVVELATFVLPIDEVIKIHISFTCLLAYSVFQGMVIADLPRSGDAVPMLSLYIDLQMAYIGLIALMGEAVIFLIIRKAELRKDKPPQRLLLFCATLAKTFRSDYKINLHHVFSGKDPIKKKRTKTKQLMFSAVQFHDLYSKPAKFAFGQEADVVGGENDRNESSEDEQQLKSIGDVIQEQWIFIAEVVERFNMSIYIAAITLTPLVMFNMVPTGDNGSEIAVR